jgi:hypothetical protein
MELNADVLIEKIEALKEMVKTIRGESATPKVNVDKLVESFDADQLKVFKSMNDLLFKFDKLFHANFDSTVAQALNATLRTITNDATARTNYLVDVDTRSKKVELEGDIIELIDSAKKMKKQIEGLHDFLVASEVELPDSIYKMEDGKVVLTKANNKVLNLPRIFDVNSEENEGAKTRGRPSRMKILVLGITDGKSTKWFENDHLGKTFIEVFGTIRADHNPVGLFKACEKANIPDLTKGWDTPVEYAGKNWVAKTKGADTK